MLIPRYCLTVAGLLLIFMNEAHAYLDPGSASIIFQSLIASALGGLIILRAYWARVKAFFDRGKKPDTATEKNEHVGSVAESEDRN